MRILEVGALPFPTHQGTQALLREQCEALAGRGHEVHLLVYAHGAWSYEAPGYRLHRLPDWPRERSLRSGPSWRKVALDVSLIAAVRRLDGRLRPDVVHAHNYEALVAVLAAHPRATVVFHAHTLFEYELPTYLSRPAVRRAAGLVGGLADRMLPPRAALTLAVSPRLEDELSRRGHPADRLACSLPGITVPAGLAPRAEARQQLGLGEVEVLGYCGNLDGYQGLPVMLDAVAALAERRPRLRLLIVTGSDPTRLRAAAHRRGISDRLVVAEHGDFAQALGFVGAADVCLVPRSAPGGFPVKLLTYLAAGRPVVATRVGAAGLELGAALSVVADGDARAMAETAAWLLDRPREAARRGAAGRRLLADRFSWDVCSAALEEQLAAAAVDSLD